MDCHTGAIRHLPYPPPFLRHRQDRCRRQSDTFMTPSNANWRSTFFRFREARSIHYLETRCRQLYLHLTSYPTRKASIQKSGGRGRPSTYCEVQPINDAAFVSHWCLRLVSLCSLLNVTNEVRDVERTFMFPARASYPSTTLLHLVPLERVHAAKAQCRALSACWRKTHRSGSVSGHSAGGFDYSRRC